MQKISRDMMDLTGYVNVWKKQVFTAVSGQTDIVLPNNITYPVNRNMINVFLNGTLQRRNIDYTEFDSSTIKFLENLRAGDIVELDFQVPYTDILTSWPDIKIEEAKKVANVMKSQTFIATSNQSTFSLSTPYEPGTNSINVFLNGVKQRTSIDFSEVNSEMIIFNSGLLYGDRVEITWMAPSGQFLLGTVSIEDAADNSIPISKINGLLNRLSAIEARLSDLEDN